MTPIEELPNLIAWAKTQGYVSPETQVPPPPTGLHLATTAPGEAVLQWNIVPDVSGYDAMYSGAGLDSPVRETTTPSISWQGLAPGSYTFAVRAKSAAGVSDWARVTGDVQGGPTPTPTPPPTGVVDGVPYPSLYPTIVKGGDLAKLAVDSTLEDGEYTTSGDIKRNAVARNPGKVTLKLSGKQTPQLPDVFAGIVVTGGGLPNEDDLSKAGTFAGKLVHSCTFRDSEGFGLLTNTPGCRVTQCVIFNNGSGGIGGTQKGDVTVDNCEVHHNNLKYKRTNSNKWTRARVTVRDCRYHDNAGRDCWADNYCQSFTILRNDFRGTISDKSGDPWKAGNVAGEISDKMLVKDNVFDNDIGGAVYINEMSQETVVEGNIFRGKSPITIEMRDLARGTPHHSLNDVTIRGNRFEGPHASIAPSGAGNKISLSKNHIIITGNTGNVSIRIPA